MSKFENPCKDEADANVVGVRRHQRLQVVQDVSWVGQVWRDEIEPAIIYLLLG